jgi:RND superfamily putative drug exporter
VSKPQVSDDGRAVLVQAVQTTDPESAAALATIDRLRDEGGRASGLSRVATVDIGGASAQAHDLNQLISGGIWKVFVFVMVCSYLILLVVLRSLLLPLKAVLMNLLSIAAAYGVIVAVFQYGWLDSITGYESLGYINTVTPPLLLAIVFGLSMDYEVFLLSRIRERYLATGDNRLAVAQGLQASAKVITSAALIMVVVFGTFALTGVPQIKEIGVGLAVAIALDATLVRLVLVPATMQLMGKWNWWLPRSLDRVLPHADFEADADAERAPAAA